MSEFQDNNQQQDSQPGQTRPFMVGPKLNKPILTYVLIAITVLTYIAQVIFERVYGVDLLFVFLGKINPAILDGQFWRLITPAFLHASPLHLLANMYAVFILGRSNESINGHLRFGLLYFISAFGGNVLSFVLGKYNSLGASTATFGLLTAEAVFIWQNRDFFANRGRRNLTNIAMIFVLNLMIGLSAGGVIDNWGHLGGAIAGLFFAFLAGTRWKVERVNGFPAFVDQRTKKDAWLAFGLVFFAFAAIAAIPFFGK
ncbi:MAG: rhomboid family intramembrane serine protease [Anaerolineaceae bacterium]|jgi:rhomboid protease GluP|nr:rhomboid family intramembrane serine protease [Anaerolineaceae bacterium]MDD4042350.1 rhomboid family intramembrane serine protease [Anaerolineaceae bacterium]MDD4577413.1 rhomboid family intramembrane serine protease [Anaerolineaceae bacterium]